MKRLVLPMTALAGVALVVAVAFAQEQRSQPQMPSMQDMQGCPMMTGMMRGQRSGTGFIPQLPPGNDKLQAQMTAEIMQRAGEIAAKYAAQVK